MGDGQRRHWLNPPRAYAVVQYCLRTTELPDTKDWLEVWAHAKAVWSYYDLSEAIAFDHDYVDSAICPRPRIRHYHKPLGVDLNVFRPADVVRD